MRIRGLLVLVLLAIVLSVPVASIGQTGQPLPPNHPPMAPPGGGPGMPPGGAPSVKPPPAGAGTGAAALVWTAPADWKKETPSSAMRRAQYVLPGPGGPGECVVFYFGPGQGGDPKANIARWAGQFRLPDGSFAGIPKTREITANKIKVTLVEMTGTYVGGMGSQAGERPNYMLLGAIAEGPDASWFFRAIGPRATLQAQRAAFDKMVKSIKRGSAGT